MSKGKRDTWTGIRRGDRAKRSAQLRNAVKTGNFDDLHSDRNHRLKYGELTHPRTGVKRDVPPPEWFEDKKWD